MTGDRGSRFGEDLFGAGGGNSVDGAGSDQMPIVSDLVLGGSTGSSPGSLGADPVDGEGVSVDATLAVENGTGDHPFDDDIVETGAGGNGDPSRVFDAVGIDAVDDIGADDPRSLLQLGAGETTDGEHHDNGEHRGPGHGPESKKGLRPIFKWLIAIGAVLVTGVLAFAIFEPVQVLPRIRLAPGFALTTASGETLSSEDGRGAVTLYTFLPAECGEECAAVNETMRQVGNRVASEVDLAGAEFRRVTVALDTDDPDRLQDAATKAEADGQTWQWVGADQETVQDVVGDGFQVYFEVTEAGVDFDPVFIIVDGTGLIRGDYRYSALASDSERLTNHIAILGEELRNSNGAASVVYEAAHMFLCYP